MTRKLDDALEVNYALGRDIAAIDPIPNSLPFDTKLRANGLVTSGTLHSLYKSLAVHVAEHCSRFFVDVKIIPTAVRKLCRRVFRTSSYAASKLDAGRDATCRRSIKRDRRR